MSADQYMERALNEARKGLGTTAPNPPVGAVVVKRGEIVGAGYHKKAGGPHAEIHALRDAGEQARGSKVFVTLEPCSTVGRTGACTQALIDAGVHSVVIGCLDPNPAHAGRGVDILRDHGIHVEVGCCEEECRHLIRAFRCVQREHRPYVSLKLAVSLDGRIADGRGRSQWITGPAARDRVQALRRECDAILVGTGTIRADDPGLLPRPARGKRPLRIVPDRTGRLPLNRKVFTDGKEEQTLVLHGRSASEAACRRLQNAGIETLRVPEIRSGLQWQKTMQILAKRGVQHILCEGGGVLAGALVRAGLVDELHLITAPKILGSKGRAAFVGTWNLAECSKWQRQSFELVGEDTWAVFTPEKE